MALVYLWDTLGDRVLDDDQPGQRLFEGLPAVQVLDLARRGVNSPLTSSIGRLFDAVAFLLGCGDRVSYEAEAAVALEALALDSPTVDRSYGFDFTEGNVVEIEPAQVITGVLEDLVSGVPAPVIARVFHASVARLVTDLSQMLAGRCGVKSVVVSGGVFQNRLLVEQVMRRAATTSLRWHQHRIVPPNDGGVSLGQLQIGASLMKERGV
jgi:hydrogenase maturation protein HypF